MKEKKTICQIDPSYRAMLTPFIQKELFHWIDQNYHNLDEDKEIEVIFSPVTNSPYHQRQQEIESYIQKSKASILESELSEFLLSLGYTADLAQILPAEKLIAQKQLHH